MIVKLQRLSGNPIDAKGFREEFAARYDSATLECKTMDDSEAVDMVKLNGLLDTAETELKSKYGIETEVELPTNADEWQSLIATHGPTMVAQMAADPSKLVLIVIDMPIG